MIASGPAYPDASTCAQAQEIAERYGLRLSDAALGLLGQETPKELTNVTTFITGSVRQLCRTAAETCRELGYEPVFLTASLSCEAREAGAFLAAIARDHQDAERSLAFLAGGETVVHLTGKGLGGRNQEIALGAARASPGAATPACSPSAPTARTGRRMQRAASWTKAPPRGLAARRAGHPQGPSGQRRLPRPQGRGRPDHDRPHRHQCQRPLRRAYQALKIEKAGPHGSLCSPADRLFVLGTPSRRHGAGPWHGASSRSGIRYSAASASASAASSAS